MHSSTAQERTPAEFDWLTCSEMVAVRVDTGIDRLARPYSQSAEWRAISPIRAVLH